MNSDGRGPSLGDVVAAAGLVLGLIAVWLYVAGWTYAYHYFDRFRIPLLMTDLPKEHYFVYGGLVLWENIGWSIAGAVPVLAVAALCTIFASSLRRFGVSAVLVVTVLALLAMGRVGGVVTAQADFLEQRESDYRAYPRVRLDFGEPQSPAKSVLADIPDSDCGRLILSSPDRLFFIRPASGAGALDLDTFVVPWDAVAAMRILSAYESCP